MRRRVATSFCATLFLATVATVALSGCDKPTSTQATGPVSSPTTESTEPARELDPLVVPSGLPGEPKLTESVAQRIRQATKHNADGEPEFTNRLILEDSPYLQQHAHNPVNWYPWGDEAFERAREQNKPVLLSIGYATCHWCHVMERESFEDVEIARYLNQHYVAIKVDREERPDVDSVYIAAVRKLSGSAGWPATLWLTADREPFFGGTYFPARDGDRAGAPGFLRLLREQHRLFDANPDKAIERGGSVAAALRAEFELNRRAEIRDAGGAIRKAFYGYERRFDDNNGGWGRRKFPMPARLRFLLRYHHRTRDARAREMLVTTLDRLTRGGIHDHVGGGFHRYTVDPGWQVPHFEKMLYDNAQLALFLTEAAIELELPDLLVVARRTLDFLHRDMKGEGPGYYSALDAETDGVEGEPYVWTSKQFEELGAAEALRVVEHRSLPKGKGVVVRRGGEAPTAEVLEAMLQVRSRRDQPKADIKIVAAWNGMALEALARLALTLGDSELEARAVELAGFIEDELWEPESKTLYRTWTERGGTGEKGTASDYAQIVAGLLALFESTADSRWLAFARELDAAFHQHHFDAERGAYRRAASTAGLLAAELPVSDSAVPGANGVAYSNLLRLHAFTRNSDYVGRADSLRDSLSGYIVDEPWAVPTLLMGVDFATNRPREVVVVSTRNDSPLVGTLRSTFSPSTVALQGSPDELSELEDLVPWVSKKGLGADRRERAFVCYETVCDLPTTRSEVFAKQLEANEPL